MAKKNQKRKVIGLVSETTGDRFYYTTINAQNRADKGKLKLRKYNPRTRQYDTFVETAKSLGRNEVKKRK